MALEQSLCKFLVVQPPRDQCAVRGFVRLHQFDTIVGLLLRECLGKRGRGGDEREGGKRRGREGGEDWHIYPHTLAHTFTYLPCIFMHTHAHPHMCTTPHPPIYTHTCAPTHTHTFAPHPHM